MFKGKEHINQFLNYSKSQHNKISFLVEHRGEFQLPLLDVNITKTIESFNTEVFRKETFTRLDLNFTLFVPLNFKSNSAQTLTIRAYEICSSLINYDEETKRLRQYSTTNGYPLHKFQTKLSFLAQKFSRKFDETKELKEIRCVLPLL